MQNARAVRVETSFSSRGFVLFDVVVIKALFSLLSSSVLDQQPYFSQKFGHCWSLRLLELLKFDNFALFLLGSDEVFSYYFEVAELLVD